MIKVIKDFCFSAAHQLDLVGDHHRCKRLHGHNYRVRIECQGQMDEKGMVIDFFDIKDKVKPLIESLDHRNINDVTGCNNTTSEFMCNWFKDKIGNDIPLSAIEVWETETCGARLEL